MSHAAAAPMRILKVSEVSAIIGSPKSTLYMWMKKGTFPKPMKLGARRVGFLASDIEAWVMSRKAA